MALVCIFLDSRPAYLQGKPTHHSLLSMPLACGTVLSELSAAGRRAGSTDLRILPTFQTSADYERHILQGAPAGTTVVGSDAVAQLVREYEPSDHVLIVDPRYRPAGGLDLAAILHDRDDTRWTLHGVAVGSAEGTQEHVHCDESGLVTRVFRYYQDVTCSRIDAIVHSLVPLAPSLDGLCFESLSELRSALAVRGLLSRDLPVPSGMIDLASEQGLITVNEQCSMRAVSRAAPHGFAQLRRGTLVGEHCRIHPSARIVGPVIIQAEVTIEEGTTILGPSVIGSGSTVRRGGLVAQSVLAGGTTVSPGAILRHEAAYGKCGGGASGGNGRGAAEGVHFDSTRNQMVRLGADATVLRDVHVTRSMYAGVKLVGDTIVAGLSLVLLAPLFLVVAIAIKLGSAGPVLFGHEREGKNGKLFRCLKFRTMCQDAHQQQRELYSSNTLDGPQFKLDNDPRVTWVGGWLRATNIDELPQLINVFLGQMSIVGPRPSPFRENQICVPWRRARLSVRPGITGLWQICRDQRLEGDFHQWITYDIMYVRNLSFRLDCKILLATIVTLGGMWRVPHPWLVKEKESADQGLRSSQASGGRSPAAAG